MVSLASSVPQGLSTTAATLIVPSGISSPVHQPHNSRLPLNIGMQDLRAAVSGNPVSAPFADLVASPLQYMRPPPALQGVDGNWGYIHKPGVGTMAVAPPSPSPNSKLLAIQASHHATMTLQNSAAGSSLACHEYNTGNEGVASRAGPAAAAPAPPAPAPPAPAPLAPATAKGKAPKDVATLGTFHTIDELVQVVEYGDKMSNRPSFADRQAADKHWGKGEQRKRLSEFFRFMRVVKGQAERDNISVLAVAKEMELQRMQRNPGVPSFVLQASKPIKTKKPGNSEPSCLNIVPSHPVAMFCH